ncbi:MAG: baseplate J/gp47 family protein [Candidatus Woesearchaeota archaeon]
MTLFDKTETEIKNEILEEIKANIPQITNFNTGGVMRGFIEIIAKFIKSIYDLLNLVFKNAFLKTASGIWLDMKCAELGLYRFEARRTKGYIVFERDFATTNINIPAGTIVQSRTMSNGKKYRYFTTQNIVFLQGQTSINVEVEAELPGAEYNLPAYSIVELVNPIAGIDRIYNIADWIVYPGLDEENDENLKKRYLLKWQSISGVNLAAYESWAKDVLGVDQVIVIPVGSGAGTVDIVITSISGDASDELINDVKRTIDEKKPYGVDVYVYRPNPVLIDISILLKLQYFANETFVIQSTTEKIYEYFRNLKIGQDFIISDLISYIKTKEIKDIVIINPIQNINVNLKEIAKINSLNITTQIEQEI